MVLENSAKMLRKLGVISSCWTLTLVVVQQSVAPCQQTRPSFPGQLFWLPLQHLLSAFCLVSFFCYFLVLGQANWNKLSIRVTGIATYRTSLSKKPLRDTTIFLIVGAVASIGVSVTVVFVNSLPIMSDPNRE